MLIWIIIGFIALYIAKNLVDPLIAKYKKTKSEVTNTKPLRQVLVVSIIVLSILIIILVAGNLKPNISKAEISDATRLSKNIDSGTVSKDDLPFIISQAIKIAYFASYWVVISISLFYLIYYIFQFSRIPANPAIENQHTLKRPVTNKKEAAPLEPNIKGTAAESIGHWNVPCPLCKKDLFIAKFPIILDCPQCNQKISFVRDNKGDITHAQEFLAAGAILADIELLGKLPYDHLRNTWGSEKFSETLYLKTIFTILSNHLHSKLGSPETLVMFYPEKWGAFWNEVVPKLSHETLKKIQNDIGKKLEDLKNEPRDVQAKEQIRCSSRLKENYLKITEHILNK